MDNVTSIMYGNANGNLKHGVKKLNKNTIHPTTTGEERAINSLKRDCYITILTADKGGAAVMLDTEEYKKKSHPAVP